MKQLFSKISLVWAVVIAYQFITIILIAFYDFLYFRSPGFLISRIIILFFIISKLSFKSNFLEKFGALSDTFIVYILLAIFYKETAHLNTFLFPKIDLILSNCDDWIFGFQPAIWFSEKYNHLLFSEFMFMGYFSYYLMPLIAFIIIWIYKREFFEEFSFIVLSAYFVYYLIFILIPAAGPQFFFSVPHSQITAQGPFGIIVKLIQKSGEAPTAAFPSSHIGIMVIILTLIFKLHKTLFKIFIPLSITLLFSTVYIKAHYFVDIVAGLLSGPMILVFNKFLYLKLNSLRKT